MLYLASQSPRRQELLHQIAEQFELVSTNINEIVNPSETAKQFVQRMAIEKAQAGLKNVVTINSNDWVLGSDTIVVINNNILGKPKSFEDCHKMLLALSNKKHQVMTAVAVINNDTVFSELVITDVIFRAISDDEIQRYWQSGEPQDKAGSYGIQGLAGKFVKRIEGSYSSVVGLPLYETEQLLLTAKAHSKKLTSEGAK
ncbi:Maf family protein [Thalassotalea psychrophila]|uniref:dTTP/UTP pyrophosphatase n=1 Tax=Thalassotalea psychrophila TaxID=3065647 RepID=A0ABY9TVN8_9GAMM|nr:Maf family protein [Colwelliaceae bacterium SQ149]